MSESIKFVVAIPSRFESVRLPGKSLLDIAGKPMIQWVYERASQSGAAEVIVATDDLRIVEACQKFGAEVCMTSMSHTSGTSRLGEVAQQRGWDDRTIVVNVQGDEPLMPSELIDQVAETLAQDSKAEMSTLMTAISEPEDLNNPNVVKVVTNREGYALYFSRAPIPVDRDQEDELSFQRGLHYGRHVGIYAYRVGFLQRFCLLPPCEYEQVESLEQLRALYHGHLIRVGYVHCTMGRGVDTEADLEEVRRQMAGMGILS
jgi:3-deoxy-manno-octulosonate cytidylyltransferase (CMP-KDO synthetase)